MGATGNLSLIQEMASHMADEARAVNNYMKGNTVSIGGGLNYWGPSITNYKSKGLASSIWVRDVCCYFYRIPAPLVPGVATKSHLESRFCNTDV